MDMEVAMEELVEEPSSIMTIEPVHDTDNKENGGIVLSNQDAIKAKEMAMAKEMGLIERFKHKNWKVRAEAYEYASSMYQERDANSVKEIEIEDVGHLLAKAVSDSNAPAQEKALDLTRHYLICGDDAFAERYAKSLMKAMIEKCYGGRIGTVNKAIEVSMLLIELGASEDVMLALVEGSQAKQSKVVLSSVTAMSQAVNSFGTVTVNCKHIIKELPRIFDSKDGKVRDKVKDFTVDLCLWLSLDVMKGLVFDKIREAVRKDIESAVQQRQSIILKPSRFTKNSKEIQNVGEEMNTISKQQKEESPPDAYDLSDGVAILSKINDSWFNKLNAKKWTERKSALEELKNLASVPRIEGGDYGAIVNAIERLIKNDSNVAVVTEAICATKSLSQGLRKSFATSARSLLPCVLDKLKEKGIALIRSCQEILRVWTTYCVSIHDIPEEINCALKHKVPKVRVETLSWMYDAIEQLELQESSKLYKCLVPSFVVATTDTAAEVREAAIKVIVALVETAGGLKGAIVKAISNLDERQMKKIKESVGTSSDTQSKALSDKSNSIQPNSVTRISKPDAGAKIHSGRGVQKKSKIASSSLKAKGSLSSRPKKAKDDCVEPILADRSPEEIEEIVSELLGEANVALVKSSNWKDRLDGTANILDWANQVDRQVAGSQMECVTAFLNRNPGWEDKNVQVLSKLTDVFVAMSRLSKFGKKEIFIVTRGKYPASEKFCDTKLKSKIADLYSAFAEVAGLQFVVFLLVKSVNGHKNPKVISESLTWLTRGLVEFGMNGIKVKELIEWLKVCLESSNPSVRSTSIKVLGIVHRTVGPPLLGMLGELKSALSTSIEKEFIENPHGKSIEPIRKVRNAVNLPSSESDRTDISDKITSDLLSELNSAQWKDRAAALESIDKILLEAGDQIMPNTGDLIKGLQQRLSDKNKNLVITTLSIVSKIAIAIGKPFEQAGFKVIVDPVVRTLNDIKKTVREAGRSTLTAFTDVVSPNRVLHFLFDIISEKKFGPDGKRESLLWIQSQFSKVDKNSPFLPTIFKYALENMEDRAADVREASTGVIKVFASTQNDLLIRLIKQQSTTQQLALQPYLIQSISGDDGHDVNDDQRREHEKTGNKSPTRPSTAAKSGTNICPARAGSIVGRSCPNLSSERNDLNNVSGPLFKSQDGIDERIRKLSKRSGKGWDPEISLRPEALAELDRELLNLAREDLCPLMRSNDFRQHCKAIDMMAESLKVDPNIIICSRDVVFKWLVYRVCEANTSSLIKSLELCSELLNALKLQGIRLTNGESLILLPCLVEKCGHNSDRVRNIFRQLIKQWTSVYPASLVCAALLDGINYSKNNRTRIECVEIYAENIERHGTEYCDRGGRGLPLIASLVSERDPTLRGASLTALAIAYKIQGDGVWKLLGNLSDAQKSLIDDKFKWTSKEMSKVEDKAQIMVEEVQNQSLTLQQPVSNLEVCAQSVEAKELSIETPVKTPSQLHIEEWEKAMRIVGSTNDDEAVEGMKIICRQLLNCSTTDAKNDDMMLRYSQDANTLVEILARQVTRVFSNAIANTDINSSTRSCKYVLNTLMHSFTSTAMAVEITEGVLRDLTTKLLLWLLNSQVPKLEEGTQLLKALNVLMLKVLENSRKTVSFCALVHLIRPSSVKEIESEAHGSHQRFVDLVVKCLIKLTKTISSCIQELNIERILLSVHGFFGEMTVEEMKLRGSTSSKDDKPLRMIKTLLHELVKLLGPSIRDYTTKITPADSGEACPLILAYIDLNIQSLNSNVHGKSTEFNEPSTDTQATPLMTPLTRRTNSHLVMSNAKQPLRAANTESISDSKSPPSTPLDPAKVQLAEIFKKIGDKRRTSKGLEELYLFQEANPEIDISPHLSRTSSAFQDYISRGVKRAGEDLKKKTNLINESQKVIKSVSNVDERGETGSEDHNKSVEGEKSNIDKKSTDRKVMQSSKDCIDSSVMASAISENVGSVSNLASTKNEQAAGVANLDALRERMRSIQAQMMQHR